MSRRKRRKKQKRQQKQRKDIDMGFKPHGFKPVCRGVPTIYIREKAAHDMWQIVDLSTQEVGWLGIVTRTKDYDFVIEQIVMMKQEVHSTTTELTPEGIADATMKLIKEDSEAGIATDAPEFRANKLLFWGHSHVNMDTGASGQDDKQMEHFRQNGAEWFVRAIANKKGKIQFDVYYFGQNLVLCDLEWELLTEDDESRRQFWKDELKEHVSQLSYKSSHVKTGGSTTKHGGTGYGSSWPYGGRRHKPYGGRFRG